MIRVTVVFIASLLFANVAFVYAGDRKEQVRYRYESIKYVEENALSLLYFYDDLLRCRSRTLCIKKTVEKYMKESHWAGLNIGMPNRIRYLKIEALQNLVNEYKITSRSSKKEKHEYEALVKELKRLKSIEPID